MTVFGNDLFAYCPSNKSFTALMEGSAVSKFIDDLLVHDSDKGIDHIIVRAIIFDYIYFEFHSLSFHDLYVRDRDMLVSTSMTESEKYSDCLT